MPRIGNPQHRPLADESFFKHFTSEISGTWMWLGELEQQQNLLAAFACILQSNGLSVDKLSLI